MVNSYLECKHNFYSFGFSKSIFYSYNWPSQLGRQNTPTASRQGNKFPPYEYPGYNTKQSDGEASVMLEL